MRFGVVTFPGSNCDDDCVRVLDDVLGQEVVRLWHKDDSVQGVDCVVLPGGFSYGDYLRCGAIARFSPIVESVLEHASAGGYVLGICNGFQMLTEMGLLPGALLGNRGLKFICDDATLAVTPGTVWTSASPDTIVAPIAHHQGLLLRRRRDHRAP